MINYFTLILVLVGFGSGNRVLADNIKQFKLRGYPVDEDNCQRKAEELADQLASQAGVTIFSFGCEDGDYSIGGSDIVINYAGRQLPEGPVVEEWLYGAYKSFEHCGGDLSNQIDLFVGATNQSVFDAYCSPKGHLYIYTLDSLQIKRRSFVSSLRGEFAHLGDIVIDDVEAYERKLFDAVASLGAIPSRVLVDDGKIYIYYYAETRLNIMFVQYTGYRSVEDCESEKSTIYQTINTFDGTPMVQLCAPTERFPMPGAEMFTFVSYPYPFMFSQIYTLYMEDVTLRYESLGQCNSDKERVYAFYRNELNKEVYGSSCSYIDEEEKYQMFIFRTAEL